MADFPDIGQLLLDQSGEEPGPALERTAMENGFIKQMQVRSGVLIGIPVVYLYTAADYEVFRDFWRDTLRYGAEWFEWRDPRDGTLREVRMVDGQFTARRVSLGRGTPLGYRVEFRIEMWSDWESGG